MFSNGYLLKINISAVGWAFLPTETDEIISGCLKQYSAVILCSAVAVG
ncbi:MAG: hypothetical protein IKZ88_06790 [Neisseriaceae bacterium]|nr:hypothetical protein [Neisseriaceae bacterium]